MPSQLLKLCYSLLYAHKFRTKLRKEKLKLSIDSTDAAKRNIQKLSSDASKFESAKKEFVSTGLHFFHLIPLPPDKIKFNFDPHNICCHTM